VIDFTPVPAQTQAPRNEVRQNARQNTFQVSTFY